MSTLNSQDALAAVLRSDQAQREGAVLARSEEARELRAAVRALIQQVEEQQATINRLLADSHKFNPLEPLG